MVMKVNNLPKLGPCSDSFAVASSTWGFIRVGDGEGGGLVRQLRMQQLRYSLHCKINIPSM